VTEATRLARIAGWTLIVAIVSLLGFVQYAEGTKPPRDAVFRYSTAEGTIILYAVILAATLALAIGTDRREFFALRRPRSWPQAVALAIVVLVVVNAVGYALDPLLHASREQGLTPHGWRSGRAGQYAANLVAFGAFGPIVEELLFRGAGYTLLVRWGPAVASAVTGVAFGLWHGIPAALPVLVLFGLGLAYLRSRTDSLYPGVVLHMLFNVVALVVAVTT
jgi:membrane protease YdiL (CAAX protease family)